MQGVENYIAQPSVRTPATGGEMNREKIRKAAEDFEAVFMAEMMRPIFETVEVNENFGGGSSEGIYRSMLVDEYGKQIAKRGGIGIADHVEKQLLRLQEAR